MTSHSARSWASCRASFAAAHSDCSGAACTSARSTPAPARVCESEIRLLTAPHYDLHRLGLFFTPAPRHADLLMVTGPAVHAADKLLVKAYDAIPDPKAVIAVGACALGGVYPEDEITHGAVDRVVRVDVFVPGCPPSPLALLQGLLVAVGRLEERVAALSLDLDAGSAG